MAIRANRGVILATGGFEFDDEMKRNYLKGYPLHILGHMGNTGDGIRIALKVGADLWHMNGVSCMVGLKLPEFETAIPITFLMFKYALVLGRTPPVGFIYVDKRGKRFVNELGVEAHMWLHAVDRYDDERNEYPRIPMYAVFDEETLRAGPVGFY